MHITTRSSQLRQQYNEECFQPNQLYDVQTETKCTRIRYGSVVSEFFE